MDSEWIQIVAENYGIPGMVLVLAIAALFIITKWSINLIQVLRESDSEAGDDDKGIGRMTVTAMTQEQIDRARASDRELIDRLETDFRDYKASVDKRFDAVEKRFDEKRETDKGQQETIQKLEDLISTLREKVARLETKES